MKSKDETENKGNIIKPSVPLVMHIIDPEMHYSSSAAKSYVSRRDFVVAPLAIASTP